MHIVLIQNVIKMFSKDSFPLRDPSCLPGSNTLISCKYLSFEWPFTIKLNLP